MASVPTWEFYRLPPGRYEEILNEYDVVVFSDVEAKKAQPGPFLLRSRQVWQSKPLTFPDRVRLTVDALHRGTHIMFLGGWLSFNGEMGKGGWGRTQLREILPVECLALRRPRESTEGFRAEAVESNLPMLKGLDLAPCRRYWASTVSGLAKAPRSSPAGRTNGSDPFRGGQFGKGRVLAYTSDPAPHWGCNFVFWKQYAKLWTNAAGWLVAK